MKYLNLRWLKTYSTGFTLVEIIVTLVAAGILGAIFIHFMGTALDSSWNSVEIVRDEAGSEGVMEQIIADYVQLINMDPDGTLGAIVTNYHDKDINGIHVTTQYILFDAGGNEVPSGLSDNLKVVVQAPGSAPPSISGRYNLTLILTKSRTADAPVVFY